MICGSVAACGSKSSPVAPSSCEVVINAQSRQFLQVENRLSQDVDVDFTPELPFGSLLDAGRCELYGLTTGVHRVRIQVRPRGAEVTVPFTLSAGETHAVIVNSQLFR